MDIPERKEKKEPSNTPNIRLDSGFVVTGVFRRVREAIETGETPVLLIGVGGSGKTALLMALADEWAKAGRNLIFLSLYDTGRGLNPHFSNKVAHRASESGKSCFVITTCADLEGWPDADGV
jgi:tetraacyldisaccharide-1-P 4'-kinase